MQRLVSRRVVLILTAVSLTFAGGTVGFMSILGESWHAALYRTIVSASLTGLDTTPRGIGAQALTIWLVLSGVAIFGYLAAQVVDSIASGIFGGAWREQRRRKMIDELENHIIVCGYGRVGRRAAEEFSLAGVPFVVLDFSEEAIAFASESGAPYVQGSGVEDEDLERAGIDRARGMIVASDSDADNLYITLSAKSKRPDLTIVARASNEAADRKLRLAGADRVVTPYYTAGRMMANLMIRPQVTAFMNVLTSSSSPEFSIDEIGVQPDCGAVGRTIGEVEALQTGADVVAVRKGGGAFQTRPAKETVLDPGDVIVAFGSPDEIRSLEELFVPRQVFAR